MKKTYAMFILMMSFIGGLVFGYQLIADHREAVCKYQRGDALEIDMSCLDLVKSERTKPNYIFLTDQLMGKYDEYGWESLENRKFYIKDLVAVPSYQIYDMTQFVESTDMIGWDLQSGGLGCFDHSQETGYTPVRQEALLKLTGKTKDDLAAGNVIGYIKLPARIEDKELRRLAMSDYNAQVSFGEYCRDFSGPIERVLAFSAEHDPRPKHFQVSDEIPEEYSDYFLDKFKREGMPDAELVVEGYYQYDADQDGQDEGVIILQNITDQIDQSERNKKKYGLYTYAFYVDGDRIQELYSNKMLCSGEEAVTLNHIDVTSLTCLRMLGAFDLNGDGDLELCLKICEWEGGSIKAYALDRNNEYECVLSSPYGM